MGDQFSLQQASRGDASRLLADPSGVSGLDRDVVSGGEAGPRYKESIATVRNELQPDGARPIAANDRTRDDLGEAADGSVGGRQCYLPDGSPRICLRLRSKNDLIQVARRGSVDTLSRHELSGFVDVE